MLSQRNTHYWLWFLLFGVVSALVTVSKGEGISTETLWLLIAGFVGLVLGMLVFAPAIAEAERQGRSYESIRDTLRKQWNSTSP